MNQLGTFITSLLAMVLVVFVPFSEVSAKDAATDDPFCGLWAYEVFGGKDYVLLTKVRLDTYKLDEGWYDLKFGNKMGIVWGEPILKHGDGIYLKKAGQELKGQIVSDNFRPTHAQEFTYKITIRKKTDNAIMYSLYTPINKMTDTWEAKRIADCGAVVK